jgi:DNA integrity scanning protein DisA with diadenylate cyclase activity
MNDALLRSRNPSETIENIILSFVSLINIDIDSFKIGKDRVFMFVTQEEIEERKEKERKEKERKEKERKEKERTQDNLGKGLKKRKQKTKRKKQKKKHETKNKNKK